MILRIINVFKWMAEISEIPENTVLNFESSSNPNISLFLKGRAECYIDDTRVGDRIPGMFINSSISAKPDKKINLKYLEPSKSLKIYNPFSKTLPIVSKIDLGQGQTIDLEIGFKGLVCLGEIKIDDKIIGEEKTFMLSNKDKCCIALSPKVIILNFTNA